MKSVSVIFVMTCLAGLFDSSTGFPLQNCNRDSQCAPFNEVGNKGEYCISNHCYSKKDYAGTCTYDRQCFNSFQACINGICSCMTGYKWLRGDCVSNYKCEYNSDCRVNQYCEGSRCRNKCKFNSDCGSSQYCEGEKCYDKCNKNSDCGSNQYCSDGKCYDDVSWSVGKITGVTIGGLIVVIAVFAALEIRRRRQRQMAQALIRNQTEMQTTVVQPTYILQPGPPPPVYLPQPTIETDCHPTTSEYCKH